MYSMDDRDEVMTPSTRDEQTGSNANFSLGRAVMMADDIVRRIGQHKDAVRMGAAALGGLVAAGMGVRAISRARRRSRPLAKRVSERIGREQQRLAKDAEATLKNLSKEVERLRKKVEERR